MQICTIYVVEAEKIAYDLLICNRIGTLMWCLFTAPFNYFQSTWKTVSDLSWAGRTKEWGTNHNKEHSQQLQQCCRGRTAERLQLRCSDCCKVKFIVMFSFIVFFSSLDRPKSICFIHNRLSGACETHPKASGIIILVKNILKLINGKR